jgi:hypothetical protein
VLSVDPRDLERKGRAWQNWLNRYGVEIVDEYADGRGKVRIRQVMSIFKSDPVPYLPKVLDSGRIAWKDAGRDTTAFPDFVEYDVNEGTMIKRVGDVIG